MGWANLAGPASTSHGRLACGVVPLRRRLPRARSDPIYRLLGESHMILRIYFSFYFIFNPAAGGWMRTG